MDAVTLEAVMHFAVSMFEQGLSSATIANKLVAHFFASKADGFPDPYSDFTIRRALQDWAKGQSRTGEMRMPVFPLGLSQLLAVLPVVCHSDYEVLLFKASFLSAGGGGGEEWLQNQCGLQGSSLTVQEKLCVSQICNG